METDPYKILHKRNATKKELRAALADILRVPVPTWAEVDESLTSRCRTLFGMAYRTSTGQTYHFQAKDYKALAELTGKVADATAEKTPNATDGDIENAFIYFLKHLPPWYKGAGFSACIINSKFNEIIAQMKNGNGKTKQGGAGVSADYLDGIVRDLSGQ